jgi:16S rRNA (uracil1498-N3)-methyltransferase
MQLFLTHYALSDNTLSITEPRVVEQLTRVLRAKIGDRMMVQLPVFVSSCQDKEKIVRYTCEITTVSKLVIEACIIDESIHIHTPQHCTLAVALTNKFEKLELIVQKATEIGLQNMIFFPATRSQIREVSENKKERLEKIILEAVEQSYGRVIPSV